MRVLFGRPGKVADLDAATRAGREHPKDTTPLPSRQGSSVRV